MAAVSALAMKEQAFRGNNIYVGKDQVKTNALAEYATTLRQQVIDGAGTVSEDWIKLNFARLEAFLKSDDEEGYRVNWDVSAVLSCVLYCLLVRTLLPARSGTVRHGGFCGCSLMRACIGRWHSPTTLRLDACCLMRE